VLLALTDSLFYPLFFFGVYTAIGPWFVGEMMQGHIGVLFVHGMYLKQHWIPGSLSYYYGLMQLVLLNLPLTLYLAYFVEVNNRASVKLHHKSLFDSNFHSSLLGFLQRSVGHFVFFFALIWQMSSCYNLLYTYGVISFLLSPAKTWSIALMLYLFWKVHRPVQN